MKSIRDEVKINILLNARGQLHEDVHSYPFCIVNDNVRNIVWDRVHFIVRDLSRMIRREVKSHEWGEHGNV